MKMRLLLGSCVLLMGITACGNNNDPQTQASPSQSAATATPEPTPCALEDASTEPKMSESDAPFSSVVDIRPNPDGCPRIVYEFKDQVPSYNVSYAGPPFADCGSGAVANVGEWGTSKYITVRLEPAGGGDLTTGEPTYTGPTDIPLDGDILKHMKRICDFEAVYEWVIGLDAEHPFDVVTFDDPPRLVIDISES